ncbi:MAG: flagellar biosynthetic protein FliQ [Parvularculaceae bacterium]
MSETEILSVLREFLWAGVWIASPMLLTALVVGVVIGLLQALTSVQELTLTFVPKLIAMLLAFVLCAGFASRLMLSLFNDQVLTIISGA